MTNADNRARLAAKRGPAQRLAGHSATYGVDFTTCLNCLRCTRPAGNRFPLRSTTSARPIRPVESSVIALRFTSQRRCTLTKRPGSTRSANCLIDPRIRCDPVVRAYARHGRNFRGGCKPHQCHATALVRMGRGLWVCNLPGHVLAGRPHPFRVGPQDRPVERRQRALLAHRLRWPANRIYCCAPNEGPRFSRISHQGSRIYKPCRSAFRGDSQTRPAGRPNTLAPVFALPKFHAWTARKVRTVTSRASGDARLRLGCAAFHLPNSIVDAADFPKSHAASRSTVRIRRAPRAVAAVLAGAWRRRSGRRSLARAMAEGEFEPVRTDRVTQELFVSRRD